MKHKTKKQRYYISLQQKSPSRLAEMALHQQSQIQQYSPFANPFLYVHMKTLNDQSQLSTWNQNKTLYPNNTISQSAVQLSVQKKKISQSTQRQFHRTRHISEHRNRLCKETIQSIKGDKQESMKKQKVIPSKARCAISLINPKFDYKKQPNPIQTQAYLKTINSHNFTTQKKQKTREKRSLVIKKIKRDLLHGLEFKLKNRCKTNSTEIYHQSNKDKTLLDSRRYAQIQLKFNSASVDKKSNKQEDYSSRMSYLQTYRNDHYMRGKTIVKRQRTFSQLQVNSKIRTSQEFIQLKSLLNRQKVEKVQIK